MLFKNVKIFIEQKVFLLKNINIKGSFIKINMRYKKLTTVILSLSLAFSLSACVMSKQKTKEAKNNQEYTNIQDSLVAKYNKKK